MRKASVFLLALTTACGGASQDLEVSTAKLAKVKTIPEGFRTVTAGLVVDDIDAALAFYEKAFGGKKQVAMPGPDGKTMYAELRLGDSVVMLAHSHSATYASPSKLGGSVGSLNYYVEDPDALYEQAIAAGAKSAMPMSNQFWGDRWGMVIDPFGHSWGIGRAAVAFTGEQIQKASALSFGPAAQKPESKKAFETMWNEAPKATMYRHEGYADVTASLHISGGKKTLAFYNKAFGAKQNEREMMQGESLMHGEMQFGTSMMMFSDEMAEWGTKSPNSLGGNTMSMYVYVPNVDEALAQAKAAGAKVEEPAKDQFWGDRVATVKDPTGHLWSLAQHQRDMTPEEMKKAFDAMMKQQAK